MKFLEKDLEEIIFNASSEKLQERGLPLKGKRFRQLRIGNYGVADLVTIERPNVIDRFDEGYSDIINITVFELKKENIGISAFLQAIGYIKGINDFINNRKKFYEIKYNIVLIGNKMDLNSNYCYLDQFVDSDLFTLNNYIYEYDIDGIKFNLCTGYELTNKGF